MSARRYRVAGIPGTGGGYISAARALFLVERRRARINAAGELEIFGRTRAERARELRGEGEARVYWSETSPATACRIAPRGVRSYRMMGTLVNHAA